MAAPFVKVGAEIWRDDETDGIPGSGVHDVDKPDMRRWMATVESPISLAIGPAGPGLQPKASVVAATTTNITLSGAQTIDGVGVVAGNRVLVKDQTDPAENGLYAAASGSWIRASDMNVWEEVPRALVPVAAGGTANGSSSWVSTSAQVGTIGATPIAFSRLTVAAEVVAPDVHAGARSVQLLPNDGGSSAKAWNKGALQTVIDYGHANGLQTIEMSAGKFTSDPGIYLDPPGNLRSTPATPTIFGFSMHLKGAGGLYNHNDHGTQLLFADNSQPAVISGTGQGMKLSGFSVIGPTGATSRAALPANGIGIALAGGGPSPGGSSRNLLEDVGVRNFRTAYKTGYNADGLCDSNTFMKCVAFDCHTGAHISRTQNYINEMIACDFGGNKIHVLSDVAKAVNIRGGNFSTANTWHRAFAISGVSGLSTFTDSVQIGDAPFTNASFTATITAPDQPFADGAYDAFVINTLEFGPIALRLLGYNPGTGVATFTFYAWWLLGSGFDVNFGGTFGTRLAAALSGATLLYACESIITFRGLCFNVDGPHIENPNCVTTLFHMTSGFGGDDANRFNRLTFNYDLDHGSLHGGAPDLEAVFMCQAAFPFIHLQGYNDLGGNPDQAVVEFSNIGTAETANRILIDAIGRNRHRLIVRGCDFKPNLRTLSFTGGDPSVIDKEVAQRGFGEWDETPFFAAADTLQYYSRRKLGGVPFEGYYPAEHAVPTIRASMLASIDVAVLPGLGTYPPMVGRRPYRVNTYDAFDAVGGVNASRFVELDHFAFAYGQNLTINWSYVAGTNVLRLDSTTRMFAGLRIILDNGSGDVGYVVTGVYPALGYVTVMRHGVGSGLANLAGTAGTTYSGGTIKQEPFSFSRVGFLPASKNVTNTNSGAQTAGPGDLTGAHLVNLLLTAIGANNFTTRTAAQMFAEIPGAGRGMKYEVAIRNTNASTLTLVGGTGVTITGTATIAQNVKRRYEVEIVSPTAFTFTMRDAVTTL
jgi:hypothetical protein